MEDETFPQFKRHAMPCEGCGELVTMRSTDPEATAAMWAVEQLVAWCPTCWQSKFGESERVPGGG